MSGSKVHTFRCAARIPIRFESHSHTIRRFTMTSLMRRRVARVAALAGIGLGAVLAVAQEGDLPQQPWSKFKVHDMTRPAPPVVTPGTPSTAEQPGKPPSDAIVLFDGKDLSN